MNELIVVGLIVGLPLLASILFRVSAVLLFLSITAGNLLANHIGLDMGAVIGSFVRSSPDVVSKVGLQLVPVGVTLVMARKSVSRVESIFHLAPIILSCAMLGVLTLPLLASGTEAAFYSSFIGSKIRPASDLIVSASAISVLLLVWLTTSKKKHGKKH